MKRYLAERGFDPRTSGLWAQHASTAPLCCYVLDMHSTGGRSLHVMFFRSILRDLSTSLLYYSKLF